jgi:hypothetical protein
MVKAEWDEWKSHPVTQDFFKAMRNRKDELLEDWVRGSYTTESVDGTAQRNALALGRVHMLTDLLEATYEDVTEDAANVKHS